MYIYKKSVVFIKHTVYLKGMSSYNKIKVLIC